MIPLSEPLSEYRELKPEIDAAIQDVCAAGHYILGPNVKAFEKEMATYCDCPYAVGVANGTDALHLALRALRLGPGDEVITTPFTFVATSEAIGMVGATPVFVDINPRTFNIDVHKIEAAITPRTKCILPVHLYGQPCDMDPIMEIARRRSLFVVEDCAQSIGAKYKGRTVGTIGDAGCLSFFPSKNLGCVGDGGMVLTRDASVFERVEMLRRHGGKIKYHHDELGLNSRLDELQAAVLRIKLKSLPRWTERRREAAHRYNVLLHSQGDVTPPSEWTQKGYSNSTPAGENPDLYCVYHQYTVVVRDRDAVMAAFKQADIGCAVYYPIPLHLQAVHANLGLKRGMLPQSERAADHCVSLPMSPFLTEQQQKVVVSTLATCAARRAA